MAVDFNRVKEIFVDKLGVDDRLITLEASITDDLGADSVDVIELIMAIEKEFKIDINENEIDALQHVGELMQYIEAKI